MNILKERPLSVRVRLDTPDHPFPGTPNVPGWEPREDWPAHWIAPFEMPAHSAVVAYRLQFTCETPQRVTVYVTADQRYWLYADGQRVGRGSERGCAKKWFYETYEIEFGAGAHTLGALTWHLTEHVPWAQVSLRPGFLLAAADPATEQLSTGRAAWECQVLANVTFLDPTVQVGRGIGCGARVRLEGDAWEDCFQNGPWSPVTILAAGNNGYRPCGPSPVWILHPARLPAMRWVQTQKAPAVALVSPSIDRSRPLSKADTLRDEAAAWQVLLDGTDSEISIPARTERTVILDLQEYLCGDLRLATRGGSGTELSVGWAERLSPVPEKALPAADRLGFDGLFFVGVADEFRLNGQRDGCCEPLWWQAGRWVRITIATGDEPLTITGCNAWETGYPLESELRLETDSPDLNRLIPLCERTLRSCTHETYMDCPYWEQLQYAGDVRIGALLTYVTSRDTRLVEKAIDIFQHSMEGASPFPAASFPNRGATIIAPWALCWIGALYDYALWRGNPVFVRSQLPLAWWIVDHFLISRAENGLIRSPDGWNYVDSTAFPSGEPPGAEPGGISGVLNWQLVLALGELATLSDWLGEPERAQSARRAANTLASASQKTFWNAERGVFADDPAHISFSEHAQALALLSGRLSPEKATAVGQTLATSSDLVPAGPYFTHYVCQALAQIGANTALHARFGAWNNFLDAGLQTCPEHGLQDRSDCHMWSAHPLYHLVHSVLGIQPAEPGFGQVLISPQLGNLGNAEAEIPHPAGKIFLRLERCEDGLAAEIFLPGGVTGRLTWGGRSNPLRAGTQKVLLHADDLIVP